MSPRGRGRGARFREWEISSFSEGAARRSTDRIAPQLVRVHEVDPLTFQNALHPPPAAQPLNHVALVSNRQRARLDRNGFRFAPCAQGAIAWTDHYGIYIGVADVSECDLQGPFGAADKRRIGHVGYTHGSWRRVSGGVASARAARLHRSRTQTAQSAYEWSARPLT